jgi:CheY-like chemotaxis protein
MAAAPEKIAPAAQRLLGFLDTALDLERIQGGSLEYRAGVADPAALLAGCAETARADGADQGRAFEFSTENLPPAIFTDPEKLRRAVAAMLAHGAQAGCFGVCLKAWGEGGREEGVLVVEVAAQGPTAQVPLSQEEAFYLPVAQALAAFVGGSLEVYGEGAAVCLRLPYKGAALSAPEDTPLAGRRLLVVDNGLSGRRPIKEMLEGTGLAIEEASSQEEALARFGADPWDAVLVDLQMPKGPALVQALQKRGGAKIIALAVTAPAFPLGEAVVLYKPVEFTKLYRVLGGHHGE